LHTAPPLVGGLDVEFNHLYQIANSFATGRCLLDDYQGIFTGGDMNSPENLDRNSNEKEKYTHDYSDEFLRTLLSRTAEN
jgi:hypothetical protein